MAHEECTFFFFLFNLLKQGIHCYFQILSCAGASRSSGSPSTKAIINAIDANVSSDQRKEMLMAAIKKKVQNKCKFYILYVCFYSKYNYFLSRKKRLKNISCADL